MFLIMLHSCINFVSKSIFKIFINLFKKPSLKNILNRFTCYYITPKAPDSLSFSINIWNNTIIIYNEETVIYAFKNICCSFFSSFKFKSYLHSFRNIRNYNNNSLGIFWNYFYRNKTYSIIFILITLTGKYKIQIYNLLFCF